jgi:K+-sensing histidine kinase KdpD
MVLRLTKCVLQGTFPYSDAVFMISSFWELQRGALVSEMPDIKYGSSPLSKHSSRIPVIPIASSVKKDVPSSSPKDTVNDPESISPWTHAQNAVCKTTGQLNRVIQMIQHLRAINGTLAHAGKEQPLTSVHDSVFQILRAMPYEIPMSRITILKIIPYDLRPVRVRRDHLEMVLFQLIYRALQAINGDPGIVTIEAQEKLPPTEGGKADRYLVLRVSDTGTKIPEADLLRIFDPEFVMTSDSTGNLLSLFVARNVAELYRGKVRVEPNERGTSVFVELLA